MSNTSTEMEVVDLPMNEVWADADFNCRGKIQPIDVIDLAKDIEANGLIQPVTVAPLTVDELQRAPAGVKYRLIAGYRRHTAHIVLKRTSITAIIREDMQDEEKARCFNLSENLHRKELDILQEMEAMRPLKTLGMSETAAAKKLGVSRAWVQIRYMMLTLPHEICEEVAAYKLTNKQVRNLYSIYGTAGLDSTISAVKKMKDAKLKGRTINLNPNLTSKASKRVRTRGDILQMLDYLGTCGIAPGLHGRCLAWAAGEVSDLELYRSLVNYAEREGYVYHLPDDVHLEDLPDEE